MPPPHALGQCGTAKPAECNSANQAFWNVTNRSSATPVCVARQPEGTCSAHHCRTCARNSSSSVMTARNSLRHLPFGAVEPDQAVSAEPGGEQVAGGGQAEWQPAQGLAVARQPGQRGLVAESDGPVQLGGDAEDALGRLERCHPQREGVVECLGTTLADTPQRVLGQHLEA